MARMVQHLRALVLLILFQSFCSAFIAHHRQRQSFSSFKETRHFNFFQDLLGDAFANDDRLSSDKSEGQLEGPGDSQDDDLFGVNEAVARLAPPKELTATQAKWRELNSQIPQIEGDTFSFNFFLSGVPNKDPSNDLYGSKVNISSRDRQVGQMLPKEPTVSDLKVYFGADGKCQCKSSTPFTIGSDDDSDKEGEGDWLVSEDGKNIRFRIQVTGYSRTVETKGTIQSVAWSDQPDQQLKSSTVYSIPQGWIYCEATISKDNRSGKTQWEDGILKIEQAAGLLGAGSKMSPCGKFSVDN